jgi:hypothetical protein
MITLSFIGLVVLVTAIYQMGREAEKDEQENGWERDWKNSDH